MARAICAHGSSDTIFNEGVIDESYFDVKRLDFAESVIATMQSDTTSPIHNVPRALRPLTGTLVTFRFANYTYISAERDGFVFSNFSERTRVPTSGPSS